MKLEIKGEGDGTVSCTYGIDIVGGTAFDHQLDPLTYHGSSEARKMITIC
jgi:hypothetical protein